MAIKSELLNFNVNDIVGRKESDEIIIFAIFFIPNSISFIRIIGYTAPAKCDCSAAYPPTISILACSIESSSNFIFFFCIEKV